MKYQKSLFGVSVNYVGIEKHIDKKDNDHVVVKIVRKNKVLGTKEFYSYTDYLKWFDNIHNDFGRGQFCHYRDGALVKRACDDITGEKWFE